MTNMVLSPRRLKTGMDKKIEYFSAHHPYLSILSAFIGVPLCILTAIAVLAIVAIIPFACLFGWSL